MPVWTIKHEEAVDTVDVAFAYRGPQMRTIKHLQGFNETWTLDTSDQGTVETGTGSRKKKWFFQL